MKQRRASPNKRGALKTAHLRTKLTPEGKQGLQDLAQSLGISITELLESIARKKGGDLGLLGEL